MSAPGLVIVCLLAWVCIAFTLSPFIGARLSGRRMTAIERDQLAWSGLAFALSLFLLAILTIGSRA